MLKRRLRNISRSRYLFHTVTVTIGFVWKRIFQTITLYEKFFSKTSIKLFIMRTILWIINISVIVHLCVEISFCWWNWLCLFFNLKHQIYWYLTETKYFSATDLNSASPLNTFKFLSVINIQWIVFPIHRSQRSSDTKVFYSSSYCIVNQYYDTIILRCMFLFVKKIRKRILRNIFQSRYLIYTFTVTVGFAWKRIFRTITL